MNIDFDTLDEYLRGKESKIIHQVWFDNITNKRNARKLFEKLRKYRESWLSKNPTWHYMCWDVKQARDLVKYRFPQHLTLYDSYQHNIQRCDAVRYFFLYRYGGLYADMDYMCNRPWDEVIQHYPGDFYLVETPNKLSNEQHVSNSLMFSKREHTFWLRFFIELEKNANVPVYYGKHMTIMCTTGPIILNRVFNRNKLRDRLDVYPSKLFHPYGLDTEIATLNRQDVYAIHLGHGSWESSDSKFLIFLYREYKLLLFLVVVLIGGYLATQTIFKFKDSAGDVDVENNQE